MSKFIYKTGGTNTEAGEKEDYLSLFCIKDGP